MMPDTINFRVSRIKNDFARRAIIVGTFLPVLIIPVLSAPFAIIRAWIDIARSAQVAWSGKTETEDD